MATCPDCHHDVIKAVIHGTETILLDPHYKTYGCIDEHRELIFE